MTVKNTILMALTGLLSFLIAALLGKVCIPWLHKLHFGQTILDIGPSWHHDKQGTPTMGGILFILSSTVTFGVGLLVATLVNPSLLALPYDTVRLLAGAVLALGCGAIGFLDDYIKVVKKRNKGLTPLQKLLLQLLLSAAYAIILYTYGHGSFRIPFFGTVNWGVWFIPFCMFVVVALSNAMNLTDGVDGLCGMTAFVAALALLLRVPVCRGAGGRSGGLPAVESAPGEGLYGRHRLPVYRRSTGGAGVWHRAAVFAGAGGDPVHCRGSVGDPAGGLFQAHSRQAAV